VKRNAKKMSRTSNIESDNSQNGGLEDYNLKQSVQKKIGSKKICCFLESVVFGNMKFLKSVVFLFCCF
jgi:hypothetical protein